jgi:hypothetical protein
MGSMLTNQKAGSHQHMVPKRNYKQYLVFVTRHIIYIDRKNQFQYPEQLINYLQTISLFLIQHSPKCSHTAVLLNLSPRKI